MILLKPVTSTVCILLNMALGECCKVRPNLGLLCIYLTSLIGLALLSGMAFVNGSSPVGVAVVLCQPHLTDVVMMWILMKCPASLQCGALTLSDTSHHPSELDFEECSEFSFSAFKTKLKP